MRKKLKRLCAVTMAIATLMSAMVFNTNAQQTNYNEALVLSSSEGLGRTGDLGLTKEDTKTPVIDSVEDYYGFTDKTTNSKKAVAMTGAATPLSSVDNSQSPYFPKIGDQGGLGACVVFATTYYQFTYTMNKARGVETTPDNTFSVKWVYNMVNYGKNDGTVEFTIYKFLKQNGCPFASTLPYDGVDYTSWSCDEKVWREAMRYRLKDSQKFTDIGLEDNQITSNDDTDLLAIKTALNNGDVLKFSSYIYSWEYDNIKANPAAPENDKYLNEQYVKVVSGYEGGHGMAIVGYNDNIWCDINGNSNIDSGEMGAFKIANSWGEGYGNDGFMWIAYDAVNKASVVEGTQQFDDKPSAISDVYRIDVLNSNEGDDFYLKFTLNTADRAQFSATFNAEKNGTTYESIFLNGVDSNISGNIYSFDGSSTACDATFVYALNDLSPEITTENFEEYDFSVTFKDSVQDSTPLIVKNVSLVNEYTGTEYKFTSGLPLSLDGSEFTADVKNSTANNKVIYYIGYDNPTLHYKTGSNSFVSVKMEENDERRGALYKYIIKDATDDIVLYFSDDSGKKDTNSGNYYTATNKLNYYYTKNQRDPLTINDIEISYGTPDVNKRCYLDIDTTGGYEPYQYKYTIEHLETGKVTVQDYGYNHEMSPYGFMQEGTYKFTIEAMDYSNNTTTFTKEFEVIDHPFQIESITLDKKSVLVSKNIEFTSITAFEGIASWGGYSAKSRFVIKDSSGKIWCDEVVKYSTYNTKAKTTTTLYNFIPHKAGEYTLTVSSTDCNKEYAEKTIPFTVYDMIIGDSNGSGDVNIMDATIIQQFLANIITEEEIYSEMSDCDTNLDINIMDATAIQCYLAHRDGSGNTGEVIEYIPPTEPETKPTEAETEKPTEAPQTNTVTFTNSLNWSGTMYCYYWSDDNTAMTSWPGKAMSNAGTNSFSQTLYTFEVPSDASYIIFTNGSLQTVDIKYTGGEVKYYALSTKTGNGYNVETW